MLDLFSEFNRIILAFQEREIRYAVVGDLTAGLLKDIGYLPGKPWTFQDTELTLWRFTRPAGEGEEFFLVDILLAGSEKFLKIIEQANQEDWAQGQIRIARKEDLIWMKSLRNSHTDRADIDFLKNE